MKNYYSNKNNSKIIIYAVLVALVLGAGLIVVQDIKAPTEHISQNIEVKLDK